MKTNNKRRKLEHIRKSNAFRKGLGRLHLNMSREFISQLKTEEIVKMAEEELQDVVKRFKRYKAVILATELGTVLNDLPRNMITYQIHFKLVLK